MGTYGTVLDALGDPTRRAILDALRHGPRSVGALAGELPVSRPAISQHLKVLGAAGLVDHESRGTRNLYRVEPAGLDPLRSWLDEFWGDVLDAFAAHVRRTDQARSPNGGNHDVARDNRVGTAGQEGDGAGRTRPGLRGVHR